MRQRRLFPYSTVEEEGEDETKQVRWNPVTCVRYHPVSPNTYRRHVLQGRTFFNESFAAFDETRFREAAEPEQRCAMIWFLKHKLDREDSYIDKNNWFQQNIRENGIIVRGTLFMRKRDNEPPNTRTLMCRDEKPADLRSYWFKPQFADDEFESDEPMPVCTSARANDADIQGKVCCCTVKKVDKHTQTVKKCFWKVNGNLERFFFLMGPAEVLEAQTRHNTTVNAGGRINNSLPFPIEPAYYEVKKFVHYKEMTEEAGADPAETGSTVGLLTNAVVAPNQNTTRNLLKRIAKFFFGPK